MALTQILILTLFSLSLMIVLAFATLILVDHYQKKRIMGTRPLSTSKHHSGADPQRDSGPGF